MNIGTVIFQQCFNVKPNESVLIVADPRKQSEAQLLFDAALPFSSRVSLLMIQGMTENAQEPPKEIAKAMGCSDVVLLVTYFSLSHTKARKDACLQGARIASLPGITKDMLERTMTSDYKGIEALSERLATILSAGKTIEVMSAAGTLLQLSIEGRDAIADTGKLDEPGSFGNLPAGEAFVAPLETSVNGTLVVDGCMADVELDEPIVITIKDGRIVGIEGGKAADEFQQAVDAVGPAARVVAEFGIGTNPNALVNSDVLEAEKVLGTCHIAFGNNIGFGGVNDAPFHSDGVITLPTVKCDGRVILDQGKSTV